MATSGEVRGRHLLQLKPQMFRARVKHTRGLVKGFLKASIVFSVEEAALYNKAAALKYQLVWSCVHVANINTAKITVTFFYISVRLLQKIPCIKK